MGEYKTSEQKLKEMEEREWGPRNQTDPALMDKVDKILRAPLEEDEMYEEDEVDMEAKDYSKFEDHR